MYGPQGTGLLLIPPGGTLSPLMEGGTGGDSRNSHMPDLLPDRLEAGTHNAPGAAGLAAGIRFVLKNGAGQAGLLAKQAAEELSALKDVRVFYGQHDAPPDIRFAETGDTHTGPISFTVGDRDSETVATILSDRNIAVRGGLHCAPLAHTTAETAAAGTVRAAFSRGNTARDAAALVRAVKELIH